MKLFLTVFTILLALGCNTNDEATLVEEETIDPMIEIDNELGGTWSFVVFTQGFGQPGAFNPGEIIWSFENENVLNVTVNVTTFDTLPLSETGVYEYEIDEVAKTIVIEESEYDYFLNDATLVISFEPESDGPYLKFEKWVE